MLHSEQEIQAKYTGSEVAEDYVALRFESEVQRLLHDRQVQAIQQTIRRTQPASVLEVAPGPGRITREITTPGEHVCLEYNEGMIEVGKQACDEKIRWVQGNAFDICLTERFNLLYTFRFVRHFHRADRNRLYAQFRKVLQPDGWLILDAVNRVVSEPLREAKPDKYLVYDKLYENEQAIRSELAEEGFQLQQLIPVQHWFSAQHKAQILLGPRSRLLARWTIRTLERLRLKPPLEWIVICRRG